MSLLVLVTRPCGAAEPAQRDEVSARESYNDALRSFDRGEYRAALANFELAYRLSPSFKIYYNIAKTNLAIDDPTSALRAFELYLELGQGRIEPEREREVRALVEGARTKVAKIDVEADSDGAVVLVNAVEVGRIPLRTLYLNPGRHEIQVRSTDGRRSTPQALDVRAGDYTRLRLSVAAEVKALRPAPARATEAIREPEQSLPWVAYGTTAALGAACAVTGTLAVFARSDERDLQRRRTSEGSLLEARSKVDRLAVATDVLLGATLVGAGVSLYLTLARDEARPRAGLVVSPGKVSAVAVF